MTSTDLAGTTALVTGATSGIGRAAALMLARRGAHVLVSGRDAARGDAVTAEIRADGGKADFVLSELQQHRKRICGVFIVIGNHHSAPRWPIPRHIESATLSRT